MDISHRMSAEGVRLAGFPKLAKVLDKRADELGEPPLTEAQKAEVHRRATLDSLTEDCLRDLDADRGVQ